MKRNPDDHPRARLHLAYLVCAGDLMAEAHGRIRLMQYGMKAMKAFCTPTLAALLTAGLALPAMAADNAELAKQTQNPIAALISVPLQLNYDENIGPAEQGEKWLLNVQPVIPFSIGQDWNLISRTIVPLVDQDGALPNGTADESGVGDIVQSLFFSPK